jgi:CheY-like chemotaxis protein
LPDEPIWLDGDPTRLEQIFTNILVNASKYSSVDRRIWLSVNLESAHGDEMAAVVRVRDEGDGIVTELLPHIFDLFTQGKRDKDRAQGGLGIGLTMVRSLVQMHGGTIHVHSEGTGKGIEFTVRLPLAQHTASLSPDAARQAQQGRGLGSAAQAKAGLEILLVEDHPDTAKLMRRLLAAQGHHVTSAGSVSEGLAAVRERVPDLLISDLGLPDGTGQDLMRRLVEEGKRVPAIALSGYGNPGDIERSRAAGFAEHLTKPLNGIEPLMAAIARLGIGR